MPKLLPLSEVPYRARNVERSARAKYDSRADALVAANFEIVSAPGTGPEQAFGWCCSREAADAVAESSVVKMPGNTQHRTMAVRPFRA